MAQCTSKHEEEDMEIWDLNHQNKHVETIRHIKLNTHVEEKCVCSLKACGKQVVKKTSSKKELCKGVF